MPTSPEVVATERSASRCLPHGGPTVDGWSVALLASSPRRLGSTSCFGVVPDDIDTAIDKVEHLATAVGLAPTFRLTSVDRPLDRILDRRGYCREAGALVMTARLRNDFNRSTDLEVTGRIDQEWLSDLSVLYGMTDSRLNALTASFQLLNIPVIAARLPGVAVGMAVIDDQLAGIFDVAVRPDIRRSGIGSVLVASLMSEIAARQCGDDRRHPPGRSVQQIFLQVHPENLPGIRLYASMGFVTAYTYWYRVAPGQVSEIR